MRRLLILAALPALAACTAAPADDDASPSAPSTAASATASATSETASATPSTAFTSTYCDHATDGFDAYVTLLEHTDAKSAETGREDGSGSVAVMNAEGAAMLAAIDEVNAEWAMAQEQADPEVAAAYTAYFGYSEAFQRPEAQLAAESTSIQEYSLGTVALLGQTGVTAAVTDGAAGLEIVLRDLVDTCGVAAVDSLS